MAVAQAVRTEARQEGLSVMVSVVRPSRNKAAHVPSVIRRLEAALGEQRRKILVVNDSDDEITVRRWDEIAAIHPHLRWWHRTVGNGPATAVVDRMSAATGSVVVVMDADGQHPPDVVPQLVYAVAQADVVIGSRACLAGWHRRALSRLSRTLAHGCCHRLRATGDPMSGFFTLWAGNVDLAALDPTGWKILVEILMVADSAVVMDVPFAFAERVGEISRLDGRAQIASARHLPLELVGAVIKPSFLARWSSPSSARDPSPSTDRHSPKSAELE